MKFSELGLDPKVLQAVEEAGYETPTPIQAQAIPHALQGRDVLGIAQTGTGKTASFTLPMISHLASGRARARMPRSLILAPTRELAAQVSENFETYGKYHKLSMALLIGGVSFAEQDRIIDRGVDVLIATPGRLIDHFERGKLMLTGIEIMVVDEADRMLDMGFIEDLERIFKLTPFTRQTLFFSATMPPEITRLTNEFLSNPVRVEVEKPATTAETIDQRLCEVPAARRDRTDREKRAALRALIKQEGDVLTNGIIFCNRKRDVSILYKSLTSHGFSCGALHGDLDQSVRMQVLAGFKNDQIKLLVASDVAARGLDIPSVSHVFNYDVPFHAEDYVHRIGRTGRAGRSGVAYTICAPADTKLLAKVEELIGKPIPRIELAGVTDATEQTAAETDSDERKPDRRGRGRGRGKSAEQDQAPARSADSDEGKSKRSRRRGGRRDGDDRPVVGMGDHVPAFLLREVPLPSSSRRTAKKGSETSAEGPDAEELNAA
ncbi:MAG: DEAD/DEAH box helicase [Pseudomonadota bacterium]